MSLDFRSTYLIRKLITRYLLALMLMVVVVVAAAAVSGGSGGDGGGGSSSSGCCSDRDDDWNVMMLFTKACLNIQCYIPQTNYSPFTLR